jgi:hypothetical protein
MPRLRHSYGLNHLHCVTTSIPARRDRARLFDSERFKRKFVTTLADSRGELGFRIVENVLLPQGGTVTYQQTREHGDALLSERVREVMPTPPAPRL